MKWFSKETVTWFRSAARKAFSALIEEIFIIAIVLIVGFGMLFILNEGCSAVVSPLKDLH